MSPQGALQRYVLITPARNEENYVEFAIHSVVSQAVRPVKWVVVNDGSTDRTDEIVRRYAAEHPWIELLRMPEHRDRNFAAKVACFQAGYTLLREVDYEFIGSLDADISFDSEYFAFLLAKFAENPRLGLAGTPFREGKVSYDMRFSSTDHVSGACQVFRRECFEAVGGYTPVKGGGIDVIAVLTARMKGWETRSFTEKQTEHHRPMGSANHGVLNARFKLGQKDYALGNHPLWQLSRSFYQMSRRPWLIGGMALGAGYCWSWLRRLPRSVSDDLLRFQRREQMARLRRFLLRTNTAN